MQICKNNTVCSAAGTVSRPKGRREQQTHATWKQNVYVKRALKEQWFLLRTIHAAGHPEVRSFISFLDDHWQYPPSQKTRGTLRCSISNRFLNTGVHEKESNTHTLTCFVLSHSRHALKMKKAMGCGVGLLQNIYFLIYNSHNM